MTLSVNTSVACWEMEGAIKECLHPGRGLFASAEQIDFELQQVVYQSNCSSLHKKSLGSMKLQHYLKVPTRNNLIENIMLCCISVIYSNVVYSCQILAIGPMFD